MNVAAPWSLSHYAAFNGFHPLYRALFDHVPKDIKINTWDNVQLSRRLLTNAKLRQLIAAKTQLLHDDQSHMSEDFIQKAYADYFLPLNNVLTQHLKGDLEFHHTAPYPSGNRPFILHCESFAPLFYPFTHEGMGDLATYKAVREHYRAIFSNPLCLGIFSHVPETRQSISHFFKDACIDEKIFSSGIGLSAHLCSEPINTKKTSLSQPIFIFINSAHQNPNNFFTRGGHLVLRFWKDFLAENRKGQLIIRCARPSDEQLVAHGVDPLFIKEEQGRTIIWIESYLYAYELNALMARAHFLLLPSMCLHSVSIMQAMTLGAVPVVTDTVGTSVYLSEQEGIILKGVRENLWIDAPELGISLNSCRSTLELDRSLIKQMCNDIYSLLDHPQTYIATQNNAMRRAQYCFSGRSFSKNFWAQVQKVYHPYSQAVSKSKQRQTFLSKSLTHCVLKSKRIAAVFESPTQPLQRVYTGDSVIHEFGGTFVKATGYPKINVHDRAYFYHFLDAREPRLELAYSLSELSVKVRSLFSMLAKSAARFLAPFPFVRQWTKTHWNIFKQYYRYLLFFDKDNPKNADIELVAEGVFEYNIIRCYHRYYAIPQSEGGFFLEKAKKKQYTRVFSSCTLKKTYEKIFKFEK